MKTLSDEECPECGGKGYTIDFNNCIMSPVEEYIEHCFDCNGTGKIIDKHLEDLK